MKVLITGGPTWIKVDDVRILTNIFTGNTSLFLAKYFSRRGNKVTLLLNPHRIKALPKNPKIIYFRYYADLKKRLQNQLKAKSFDAIIHSAAVSDYKTTKPSKGKISSKKNKINLELVPTQKLIGFIRKYAKKSCLVQFKLEVNRKGLLHKAYASLKRNRADFVVANVLKDLRSGYKGFIIDKKKRIIEVNSKDSLAFNLYKLIKSRKD